MSTYTNWCWKRCSTVSVSHESDEVVHTTDDTSRHSHRCTTPIHNHRGYSSDIGCDSVTQSHITWAGVRLKETSVEKLNNLYKLDIAISIHWNRVSYNNYAYLSNGSWVVKYELVYTITVWRLGCYTLSIKDKEEVIAIHCQLKLQGPRHTESCHSTLHGQCWHSNS